MTINPITRRLLILAGLGGGAAAGLGVFNHFVAPREPEQNIITLEWEDLVPESDRDIVEQTLNEFAYGDNLDIDNLDLNSLPTEPNASRMPDYAFTMVNDYNDQIVRIPGYVVPIGFEGDKVSEYLLVPFVGACIHVPPPPPNQIVLAQAKTPFLMESNWDPFYAVGQFKSSTISTELAEVGYVMLDARLEEYTEQS